MNRKLVTAPRTCEHFDIKPRTLSRWLQDERLGFPRPIIINGRRYFADEELEAFERSRASKVTAA